MGQESVTEIEVKMVLTAPLAYELQAAGDAMVQLIKKAPPELQPAALAAALVTVSGFQAAADAAVGQLPDTLPHQLSTKLINNQAEMLRKYITRQSL